MALRIGLLALIVIVVADALIRHEPHFKGTGYLFDTLPFFYPFIGFFSTVVLVLVARAVGVVLSRKESYYRDR